MFRATLAHLRCPNRDGKCQSGLALADAREVPVGQGLSDVVSGSLACPKCRKVYPILGGVAILIPEIEEYLYAHAKGILRWVPEEQIPEVYAELLLEGVNSLEEQHIEEDLEAERVNSLYVATHYLKGRASREKWYAGSPVIEEIIEKYWDQGPFSQIKEILSHAEIADISLVEIGCGVGGLYCAIQPRLKSYLGVDSSFASIFIARHLALGIPLRDPVKIPGDLLSGEVSQDLPEDRVRAEELRDERADFIVADATLPPLIRGAWDASASLNMIDMLDDPSKLPRLQKELIRTGGIAVQSCPYIWHPEVARRLNQLLGKEAKDSARAVEMLYEREGFRIQSRMNDVPWVFFKHRRQIEVYSVHLFLARGIDRSAS